MPSADAGTNGVSATSSPSTRDLRSTANDIGMNAPNTAEYRRRRQESLLPEATNRSRRAKLWECTSIAQSVASGRYEGSDGYA